MRNIPVEVDLNKKDGFPQECVVNTDTLAAIRKAVLVKRVCSLRTDKIAQINRALKFSLSPE